MVFTVPSVILTISVKSLTINRRFPSTNSMIWCSLFDGIGRCFGRPTFNELHLCQFITNIYVIIVTVWISSGIREPIVQIPRYRYSDVGWMQSRYVYAWAAARAGAICARGCWLHRGAARAQRNSARARTHTHTHQICWRIIMLQSHRRQSARRAPARWHAAFIARWCARALALTRPA